MSDPPLIRPAPPEAASEVLSLVFRHLLSEERARRMQTVLHGTRSGQLSLEGLLEARRGVRLVGGVFSEVQVGRTAVVWPPRLVPGEPAGTGGELLRATSEFLIGKRVCMAHTLLDAGMEEDGTVLSAEGFEPLADLLYLVSPDERFPLSRPASGLEFEAYSPAAHIRMARVIEATYAETLDCPRLNDVREIDDVMAGYRATGVFDPARWLIVRHRGEDVGCLLLADHPEQENWELVYMGLVPSARGNGWGNGITRYAQWLTRQAGRPRLVLAVDATNTPAIRVYSSLGFHPWDRRGVYLKVFERRG